MKSARLFSRDGLLVTVFTLVSALSWSNTSLAASLVLSWKDTSSNETGFKVERALGTAGSFSQIASVGANMQSYTDSSISGGNTYCYRVRAYNSTGSSSPSNKACVNVTSSSGSTGQGEDPLRVPAVAPRPPRAAAPSSRSQPLRLLKSMTFPGRIIVSR